MKTALLLVALAAGIASAQFYDHVTITSAELVVRFSPLSACIRDELGMTDTVVTVEAIGASFPGRDTPEKVRNFIKYAYSNWLTSCVLLGGDVEVVPPRYALANCGNGLEPVLTDLYYSALDGDWDADGDGLYGEVEDSVDLYPDVAVGRCPATSGASVATVVGKFISYIGNPQAPYLDRVLLSGFDLYPWCFAEQAMEFYDSTFIPEPMKPCGKVYDSDQGDHREAILSQLNAGRHLWVHSDHSGWNATGAGWTNHRWVISREELAALANQDRLTILMTNGCSAGAFDSTDCLTEYFMLAPTGGGVAAYANTRTGLLDATKPLHGQSFMPLEELLRAWFAHPAQASLGDLVVAQAQVAPFAASSARYRWTHYIFALLGEPSMPVWLPLNSGVTERPAPDVARAAPSATIVRGVLNLPPSLAPRPASLLLDAAGRRVMSLNAGPNDVSHLAPGVYFIRLDETVAGRTIVLR